MIRSMNVVTWAAVASVAVLACSGGNAGAPSDGAVGSTIDGRSDGARGGADGRQGAPPVTADVRNRTGARKLTRGPRAWPQFAYSAANVSASEARVSDAPALAWTTEIAAAGAFAYASPVVGDGRLFVTLYGGGIAALDVRTGKVVWHNAIVMGNKYGTAAFGDGRLIASVFRSGSGHADLVALDAATGNELWRSPTGAWGSLKLTDGLVFVSLFDTGGNTVVAVDAPTGTERWRRATTCKSEAAVSGGRLYCAGQTLTALDVASGAVVYEVPSGDSHFMSTPAISDDRVVVVGSALRAYATADGRALWSSPFQAANRPLNGGSWYETSPAIDTGLVVVIGTDGVSAYSLADGQKRWTAAIGWPGTTPSIADGLVLAGPALLDLQTGNLVWRDDDRNVWPTAALIDGGFFFVEHGGRRAFGYTGPVAGEPIE